MTRAAYLVLWRRRGSGEIVDAGIYSEPTPTPRAMDLRSFAVLTAERGTFDEARAVLERIVDRLDAMHVVRSCRTYRLQRVAASNDNGRREVG